MGRGGQTTTGHAAGVPARRGLGSRRPAPSLPCRDRDGAESWRRLAGTRGVMVCTEPLPAYTGRRGVAAWIAYPDCFQAIGPHIAASDADAVCEALRARGPQILHLLSTDLRGRLDQLTASDIAGLITDDDVEAARAFTARGQTGRWHRAGRVRNKPPLPANEAAQISIAVTDNVPLGLAAPGSSGSTMAIAADFQTPPADGMWAVRSVDDRDRDERRTMQLLHLFADQGNAVAYGRHLACWEGSGFEVEIQHVPCAPAPAMIVVDHRGRQTVC